VFDCRAIGDSIVERAQRLDRHKIQQRYNSCKDAIRETAAINTTGSVLLVVTRGASGRNIRPRQYETAWT